MKALLEDVKDEYWKKRIEKSIQNILHLYKLKENDIKVFRTKVEPKDIWVVAVDECDPKEAERLIKVKYSKELPPPITLIEYKNKKVIFIGSNRSLVFVLKNQIPDCIIVKLPDNIKEPIMISEAKINLEEISKGYNHEGKMVKEGKWKVKCPICGKEVISECWGCFSSNTLFHCHEGKEDPDLVNLDDYELKWEEVK